MDEVSRNTIAGAVHASTVQARDVGAIVMAASMGHAGAARVPRQLPALGGPVWVNRAAEVQTLDRLVGRPGPTRAVLTGMGGVGKTAMAVHWLVCQRGMCPDGELYCDLGGWSGRPSPPSEQVLAAWLRALGVGADDVPHELSELAALYRTVTADRSMLILVDNAQAAAQVRPLLPASSTSVLLVTSRRRLPDLLMYGFDHLALDCLSTHDATTLLAGLLPHDRPAPTETLRELAARCGGLPLAVTIAGGHLVFRQHHSPAELLARLDADPRRSLELRLGEHSVGAVLDMSYEDLDAAHARLYRLCALHPGREFTAGPLAVACGQTESSTEDALATLADAHLVVEAGAGRYRLHDLIREHADHQLHQRDAPGVRNLALRKMITWYLHRTAHADRALNGFAPRFGAVFDLVTTSSFATAAQAMDWFESERASILAAQQLAADRGWDDLVCQLAEALWNPVRPNYTAEELLRTQQLGVESARRIGHTLQAVCQMRVAFAETNRGRHEAAIAAATAAFDLATALNHRWTQSAALSTRARAHLANDDPHAAIPDAERSLEIETTLPNPDRGIALRQRHLGQAYAHSKIADYLQAIEHFRRAAALMHNIGDHIGHSRVVIDMVSALLHTGQGAGALAALDQVADAVRSYGSLGYSADLCAATGRVHDHLGDIDNARRFYTEAIQLYDATGPGALRQRDSVATLRDALPDSVHTGQSDG